MQQTRKPGPQRALVLAGGGAKGSYQVGVWQELGWTPDIITGASVGALNGCLFTMGKSKEAEDLWRGLEIHDVLEVPASLKPEELNNFFLDVVRSGGLNVEPLAETIDRLIDEDAVATLQKELLPLAEVATPNIPEAEVLSGRAIRSQEDMVEAAKAISETYGCAVLCKGGHNLNDANDLLSAGGQYHWFHGKRIDNPNTHGTGCTLSSAIAANLAKGFALEDAVRRAKDYISGALGAMLDLGKGSGPMNHAFALTGEFSREAR